MHLLQTLENLLELISAHLDVNWDLTVVHLILGSADDIFSVHGLVNKGARVHALNLIDEILALLNVTVGLLVLRLNLLKSGLFDLQLLFNLLEDVLSLLEILDPLCNALSLLPVIVSLVLSNTLLHLFALLQHGCDLLRQSLQEFLEICEVILRLVAYGLELLVKLLLFSHVADQVFKILDALSEVVIVLLHLLVETLHFLKCILKSINKPIDLRIRNRIRILKGSFNTLFELITLLSDFSVLLVDVSEVFTNLGSFFFELFELEHQVGVFFAECVLGVGNEVFILLKLCLAVLLVGVKIIKRTVELLKHGICCLN